jgi:hypothetical protein
MTRPLTDALHSTASLDIEREHAEATVRMATSVAKASEHWGINTLGLWLRIAETREALERLVVRDTINNEGDSK